MDLNDMTGPEAVEWFATEFNESGLRASVDARTALRIIKAGVTSTDLIVAFHTGEGDLWKAVPAGALSNDDDLRLVTLIGPRAYLDDPEQRVEWAAIAKRVNALDAAAPHGNRANPDGKGHRYHFHGWEACEAFMAAGRGPTYARRILTVAERYNAPDLDAFGFDIDPSEFEDFVSAGVYNTADLSAYLRAGLSVSEALIYRTDGIPAAAVLMAKAEGHDKSQWPVLLHGVPAQWFRDLSRVLWSEDEVDFDKDRLHYHLRNGGNDRYTLADLRYLAEHGWPKSEYSSLSPSGLSGLSPDLYAETARTLAAHGMDWDDMDRWAKACAQGKTVRDDYSDATLPALLRGSSHQRGHGTNVIYLSDLDRVLAMVDRGIKASHVNDYRKGGCRTPEDICRAYDSGITPARVRALLHLHGEKKRWSKSKTLTNTAMLHAKHQTTPADAEAPKAERRVKTDDEGYEPKRRKRVR